MIEKISRRLGLKWLTFASLFGLNARSSASAQSKESGGRDLPGEDKRVDRWHKAHDRVWLGGHFWANPMEDWVVSKGHASCQTSASNRSIHSLTHRLEYQEKAFSMVVMMERPADSGEKASGGFRIGIRSEIDELRSNCFAKGGIDAGIVGNALVLGRKKKDFSREPDRNTIILHLSGGGGSLKLSASCAFSGESLGSMEAKVDTENTIGNLALVSQFSGSGQRKEDGKVGMSFTDWRISGKAITVSPAQKFGPLLWSMYSLSDSRSDEGFVMKMSALTGPMGTAGNKDVELLIQKEDKWESLGSAELDADAWTATFRIANWDESLEARYKLIYRENHKDGTETPDEWEGTIKANPDGRPLRLGALTCQNDYGYPYAPVADNLIRLDSDMLYFSGDQLYESHGGFGIIRDPAGPAILSYLRKFYQFGWAFREAMKDRPTLCIPDDHDVFQGNIWGEGGAPMKDIAGGASSKGGYREPARMVNAVHRTNCGHHPDAYDPNPSLQDISVYYGDMVYGGVSFAVLGDRQWKSGPDRVETGSGRADHVLDPEFDTSLLDRPDLVLLGERQEEFLKKWGEDWRGHSMKVLLSQTVFAGVATHHGKYDGFLKADLDSGGWPQTARNRAIDILRSSMALHINGDQHLTTLSQYGVEKQRDSNWSFCTPAIAAGYPRWWRPDEVGMHHENRPSHGHDHTGEYLEGFGNKVYVYAVGNPEVGKEKNRYDKAHQKGSGFGLVTIDTEKKTYTLDSFRFLIDATDGKASNQFPGWPVTIHQEENRGVNRIS